MKNIYLLGATGSIGSQTIEIIENHPEQFNLKAISGHSNLEKVIEIASRFPLDLIAVKDEIDALTIKNVFPNVKIVYGEDGLIELAKVNPDDKESFLVNALVGMVGLKPTLAAVEIDRNVLLANKETLVVGGHLIKKALKDHPVQILPIDSEHNAIWQILNGEDKDKIHKLIITASGGPFRDYTRKQLELVDLKQALNHPNWSMGKKITIDSATMMNKGFEIIEAAYLYDIDIDKIEALIHRESIIHSLVEFVDGSVIAQMANPDMRLPISYALFYPGRVASPVKPLCLSSIGKLSFEKVDSEKFPLLGLAIDAYKQGGSKRTVLNAANEAAVKLFLNEKIKFLDIEKIITSEVENHVLIPEPTLDEIYKIDKSVKEKIFTEYDK